MKKLIELKEAYPRTFKAWMDEGDIIQELDRRWTSRESWYIGRDGYGTQTFDDVDLYGNNECDGYFNLRIEGDDIKVYLHFYEYDYDEEQGIFTLETSSMVGWE